MTQNTEQVTIATETSESDAEYQKFFEQAKKELFNEMNGDEVTESPVEPAASDTPPVEKQWWELLPENQKAEFVEARNAAAKAAADKDQYIRSNEGRIAAFQRKADEAQAQANQAAKQRAQTARAESDADLTNLATEYGEELAAPVKRTRDEARATADKLLEVESTLNSYRADAEAMRADRAAAKAAADQAHITEAQDMLKKDYPNWTKDVNTDVYSKWIVNEPTEVQAMQSSTSFASADRLMRLFYAANPAAAPSAAANIAAKREARLNNSIAPTGSASAPQSAPSDYDYWFAKARKEMGLPPV